MLKKLRFVLIFLLFTVIASLPEHAFSQINLQWVQTYTSSGANTDKANDLTIDASGNVYTCGTTWNGTSFDYLTIKYDNLGVLQWSRTYNGGGNSIDEARAIAVDASGNVYVTGASYFAVNNDDYVTIKYDASGNQQWLTNYNGPGNSTDEAWDIALDASGNVFVTGGSNGGASGEDYATVKYDPSTGTQQALIRYTFTGNNLDKAQAITIDSNGDVYVTGYSYGGAALDYDYATLRYTNSLTAVWGSASRFNGLGSKIDQAYKIAVDNATGNVYVTGYSNNTYVLDDDITTVMYNSAGAQQWVSRYGALNNEQDRSYGLDIDASGNAYVTGKVINASQQDMVTVKYDNTGAQQWASVYNGVSNNWDEGRSVKVDAAGQYVYVNGFSFTTGINHDITTLKYDVNTGAQQWVIKYNSPSNNVDKGYSMALDASSNIYVAGESKTTPTSNDAIAIKYCQLQADAGPDDVICLGDFTQLNASAPGAIAYSWSPATGLSSTTISNPTANPTVTTTYVVSITNTSGCVDLDTMVVTVYALQAPAITANGPTSFCAGDSVTLCAGGTFNTYTWSPGGASTSCLTVSPASTTIYTLTVTDTNTCGAQSMDTVTVNQLPIADAGSDTSVCLSNNAQLSASGGVTYSWAPSASLSNSAVANPIAGPVVTTTYTVWVTSAAGCTDIDSVTVTVVPNPPVPNLTYNMGVICSSTATTYQWYTTNPNTPINGATSQCYTPVANDTFYVVVTNSNGCTTASALIVVNDVGIGELDAIFGSTVYPNPSHGEFTLGLNLQTAMNVRISLYNITGELVRYHELYQVSGEVKKEFDVKELDAGTYFIQLVSDEGWAVKRVVIH